MSWGDTHRLHLKCLTSEIQWQTVEDERFSVIWWARIQVVRLLFFQSWLRMYGYLPQASRQMSTMRSAQILSNAVSDMQRFYGLEVTGQMDPQTIRSALRFWCFRTFRLEAGVRMITSRRYHTVRCVTLPVPASTGSHTDGVYGPRTSPATVQVSQGHSDHFIRNMLNSYYGFLCLMTPKNCSLPQLK